MARSLDRRFTNSKSSTHDDLNVPATIAVLGASSLEGRVFCKLALLFDISVICFSNPSDNLEYLKAFDRNLWKRVDIHYRHKLSDIDLSLLDSVDAAVSFIGMRLPQPEAVDKFNYYCYTLNTKFAELCESRHVNTFINCSTEELHDVVTFFHKVRLRVTNVVQAKRFKHLLVLEPRLRCNLKAISRTLNEIDTKRHLSFFSNETNSSRSIAAVAMHYILNRKLPGSTLYGPNEIHSIYKAIKYPHQF